MKPATCLAVLGAVVLLAGCSSVAVDTHYDPSVDLTAYRSWNFASAGPMVENGLHDRRIRSAIERELGARGFRKVDTAPDFLVGFGAALETRREVVEWGTTTRYSPRYGYRTGPWYGSELEVRTYEQGTLVIDVMDGAKGELVWRGSSSATIRDMAQAAEEIDVAVPAILARFPPSR